MTDMTALPVASPVRDICTGGALGRLWNFEDALPAGLGFTRASSGRVWTQAGVLASVSTNVARIGYDPVTHAARGILMEPASTNQARATHDAGDGFWSKWKVTVGSTMTGPDGSASMRMVAEVAETQTHLVGRTFSVTAGDYMAASMYVKAAGRDRVRLSLRSGGTANRALAEFNLATGTVYFTTAIGTGEYVDSGIVDVGNGIFRIWLAGRTGTAETSVTFEAYLKDSADSFTYLGDGVSGMFMGCFQFESGALVDQPTSYIENTGTTFDVTRSGDVLVDTGLAGAGWVNPVRGTLVVDFMLTAQGVISNSHRIAEFFQNTNNRLNVTYNPTFTGSGVQVQNQITGTVVALTAGGSKVAPLVRHRVAIAYNTGSIAIAVDGGVASSAAITGLAPWTQMSLGRSAASGNFTLGGHILRAAYYPVDGLNLQQLSGV